MFSQVSVCPSGVCTLSWADTPPTQTPQADPWADIPREDTPPAKIATAGDGTHPTGMHSCFKDSNNYIARPLVFYGRIFTTAKVALQSNFHYISVYLWIIKLHATYAHYRFGSRIIFTVRNEVGAR